VSTVACTAVRVAPCGMVSISGADKVRDGDQSARSFARADEVIE
jgi:hypothetical protein